MICNIILRLPKRQPEVIYTSQNFNETIHEFENLALDTIGALGGVEARRIHNKIIGKIHVTDFVRAGYYCISECNRISIYKKERNGWFTTGEFKLIKEFELFCHRRPRVINLVSQEEASCYEISDKDIKLRQELFEIIRSIELEDPPC